MLNPLLIFPWLNFSSYFFLSEANVSENVRYTDNDKEIIIYNI